MARKKRFNRRKFWMDVLRGVWTGVKLPYYLVRMFVRIGRKVEVQVEKKKVEEKRRAIGAKYKEFKVVDEIFGNYVDWMNFVLKSDSQIGIVLGARGSGKSAFGVKFLENYYVKTKKKCFAMGFDAAEMPGWVEVVSDIGKISNDSIVLIDEGGILFSSRNSMGNANKMLSSLMMVARHKNISIVFISQNSSNLEVNILRQADFLVLKPSSLLQRDFERKVVRKIYEEVADGFEKFSGEVGLGFVYSGKFRGFVTNGLPSFWGERISKGFR